MSNKTVAERTLSVDDLIVEDVVDNDESREFGGSTAWLDCATDLCNGTTLSCMPPNPD